MQKLFKTPAVEKLTKVEVADRYISNMIDVHELPLNEHQIDFWASEISRYPKIVIEQSWLEVMTGIRPKFVPSLSDVLRVLDKHEINLRSSILSSERKAERKAVDGIMDGEDKTDLQRFLRAIMTETKIFEEDKLKKQPLDLHGYYVRMGELFKKMGMLSDSAQMMALAKKHKPRDIPKQKTKTRPPLELVD